MLAQRGHDVLWMRDASPGAADDGVLALAGSGQRILLTFDKDFGELAFRRGLPAISGVVLVRIESPSPSQLAERVAAALESRKDWTGRFSVIEPDRVRMRQLPTR